METRAIKILEGETIFKITELTNSFLNKNKDSKIVGFIKENNLYIILIEY